MKTRLIRENRLLYNEFVESKPINAISNEGARKRVKELYKRIYYTLYYILTRLEIFQEIQRYKSLFVQTLKNPENEKSYCKRLPIRMK